MLSISIVGAGLIGRLTAVQLIKQGYHVTLFDKDNKNAKQSAAYAAAGLLTPLGESLHSPKCIVEMGVESMKIWPTLLATLSQKVFFQQKGSLLISHAQDEGDYQHFRRFVIQNFSTHDTQTLNRQTLTALEPELGRSFQQGLYLPEEGQIDNRSLLNALTYELEQFENEALLKWQSETNVEAIQTQPQGCNVVFTELSANNDVIESNQHQITQHFDLVIDCRGLGAKKSKSKQSVEAEPNHLTELRGVRGELFRLYAPEVKLSRPVRLMHPRYQLYIAPKENNVYAVGATQIESDDTSPMTVRSAMELLSAAYSVHSGFGEAKILEHISQLRPAFNDNQPHIIANNALIQVNGLYRHGYLISPVVSSQVVELVNNINKHFTVNSSNKTINSNNNSMNKAVISSPLTYSHLLPITLQHSNKEAHL